MNQNNLTSKSNDKAVTPEFGSKEYRTFFRESYIFNDGKWKFLGIKNGNLYFLIILLVAISMPIFFASQMTEFKIIYFLLMPIYFLICNLFEYLLHRFPMHHKTKGLEFFFEHVTVHHSFYSHKYNFYEQPKDYMAVFLPMLYFAVISIAFLLIGFFIYFVSDLNNALFFETVVYVYYLMYETLHFAYHAKKESLLKKIPFVDKLSKFHLLHHHTGLMSKYNFNITFPIFDKMFNTQFKSDDFKAEYYQIKSETDDLGSKLTFYDY
jgi:hypothetical protein